jgi:hypothetical protein
MIASLQSWETKSLLYRHLAEYPTSVVVGRDAEYPRGFYSCTLAGVTYPIELGIIVDYDVVPSLVLLSPARRVLVGHDQSISSVDLGSGLLLEKMDLDGVFFEFLRIEQMRLILVMHELGCIALSEHGIVLWQHTTRDILVGWSVVGSRIELAMWDVDTPDVLNLRSGSLG